MDSVDIGGGTTLAVERSGSGHPVLCIGGLGMPSFVWQHGGLATALAEHEFDVVSYNARGLPPSTVSEPPYSIPQLADDAAALIDTLQLVDPIVVGYSLGSYTTQALLARHPNLVRAAVLCAGIDPSPITKLVNDMELGLLREFGRIPTEVLTFEQMMTTLPSADLQDHETATTWRAIFESNDSDPIGMEGQLRASESWYQSASENAVARSSIPIPVQVIAFEHDLFMTPRASQAAAEQIPDCEYVQVADAAHGGLITHAQATITPIVDFCIRHKP